MVLRNSPEYYIVNKERINANRRARYHKDKAEFYKKNRRSILKRRFGLTEIAYETMLKDQDYCCALCFKEDPQRNLSVDHDHITGQVRGLLCNKCNRALGLFSDNREILQRAVDYLGDKN